MNTLKQLVLQETEAQKILLKIQTFMKCALEVSVGAWQSRELPYSLLCCTSFLRSASHHEQGCTCTVLGMGLRCQSLVSEPC